MTHPADPRIATVEPDNRVPGMGHHLRAVARGVWRHALFRVDDATRGKAEGPLLARPWGLIAALTGAFAVIFGVGAVLARGRTRTGLGLGALASGLAAALSALFGAALADVQPPPHRPDTQRSRDLLPGAPTRLVPYVADAVWVAQQPLAFHGLEMGTRMTVLRADDGDGLVIYSPIALTEPLREAVAELGRVVAIVAPNALHHLFVGDWLAAFPDAQLWAAPGLPERRPDLPWHATIEADHPDPRAGGPYPWDTARLQHVVLRGHDEVSEVVFLERTTGTLVVCDALENLGHGEETPAWTRTLLELAGMRERPTPPTDLKLTVVDPYALAVSAATVHAWPFRRIVLAHGRLVEVDARRIWADAYAWVLTRHATR